MREYLISDLRYFVAPIDIMDVPNLSIYEQMAYFVILSFANPRDKTAFPSYSTIAKLGRMSRRKAIEAVTGLIEKGLLEKQSRGTIADGKYLQTSNQYLIKIPGAHGALGGAHGALGGAHGALGVVHDMHQGGAHGAPYIDLDQDKDIDLDQIDPELRKHIEKLGLLRHAKDIAEIFDKRQVTKKVFFDVLERVAEAKRKGEVRSLKGYLIRSLKNEAGKRNEGLPESMTSPPVQEISEQEAKSKLARAESLLKRLYQMDNQ